MRTIAGKFRLKQQHEQMSLPAGGAKNIKADLEKGMQDANAKTRTNTQSTFDKAAAEGQNAYHNAADKGANLAQNTADKLNEKGNRL